MRTGPAVPLAATTAVQTLVTMNAYSMSVAAPAVADALGLDRSNVGLYTASVYAVGMFSGLLSPDFVHRFGAIRVSQFCVVAGIAGVLVAAASQGFALIALSAVVIGLGYGAPSSSSSHVLVRVTPPRWLNLVFSIRQTGVPLGGMAAGIAVPLLVQLADWRTAYLAQVVPGLLLLAVLQWLRPTLDDDRAPDHPVLRGGLFAPLRLVVRDAELRSLAVVAFVYSGSQICFSAFMVVYLTGQAGFSLAAAGGVLAAFQIAGVTARVVWGWLADRAVPARGILAGLGLAMAVAALLAGNISGAWPSAAVIGVAVLAGASASGYTGLCMAEMARLGGPGRAAEATGACVVVLFLGAMSMPAGFTLVLRLAHSYALAYDVVAGLSVMAGALLLFTPAGTKETAA